MKAIVVDEIGVLDYRDVPKPEPAEGEVLVEVAVAGLCRTDLKLIEAGHRDLTLPRIPAEEVVGTVCELGAGVDGTWLGERVYVYPGTSCGRCRACRAGAGNLCKTMRIMGFHRDGGFADFVSVPVGSLIRITDGTAFERAVFAEPLSCCLNALELARLCKGEHIGIWGAGPAGTLVGRVAQYVGATTHVVEPDLARRVRAGGVETLPPESLDVAVVAVGSAEAYEEAYRALAPRGRLILFSGLSPADSARTVDFNRIHYLEQSIVGSYGCSHRHGVEAIELIRGGAIAVEDLISHRLPLYCLEEALEVVRDRHGMKILLYPEEKWSI